MKGRNLVRRIVHRYLVNQCNMLHRKKDNCQVCHGKNGGVPGNENIINGVVTCDYCSALRHENKRQ